MRDVLVIGLAIAVVLVLIKVIWGSPFVTRVREGFAGSALINVSTQCPIGSTMYMYDGQAYCCSTNINPDADSVQQTCKPPPVPIIGSPPFTFCALGPSSGGVQNCLELRSGLLQAEGETRCTTGMPNFVKGYSGSATAQGRCCGSPGNEQGTDCADLTQPFCDVTAVHDFLQLPNSCQFQRLAQNISCPSGYNETTIKMANGDTVIACSSGNTICYPESMLSLLKARGDDTSIFQPCASS